MPRFERPVPVRGLGSAPSAFRIMVNMARVLWARTFEGRSRRAVFSFVLAEGRIFLKRMNGMNADEDKMAVLADKKKKRSGAPRAALSLLPAANERMTG